MILHVVFTYRCNLQCKWCDRLVGLLPWDDTDLSVEDLRLGVKQIREVKVKIEKVRISSGEPLVHPKFEELIEAIKREWQIINDKPIMVLTNGTIDRPKLSGSVYALSPPETKEHHPSMISPADLGFSLAMRCIKSCKVARVCGRAFNVFGFSFCAYAPVIGRFIGIDPHQSYPVMLGSSEICQHCIYSLNFSKRQELWKAATIGEIEFPTKTYREGLKRKPMKFKRFQERL